MRIELNGWQRIGIVASVVWIIGAGIWTLIVLGNSTEQSAEFFYNQCAETRNEMLETQSKDCARKDELSLPRDNVFNRCMDEYRAKNPNHCSDDSLKFVRAAVSGERVGALLVAIVPVPIVWGFAYLGLFLVRWVKRGFTQSKLDRL